MYIQNILIKKFKNNKNIKSVKNIHFYEDLWIKILNIFYWNILKLKLVKDYR